MSSRLTFFCCGGKQHPRQLEAADRGESGHDVSGWLCWQQEEGVGDVGHENCAQVLLNDGGVARRIKGLHKKIGSND